jgi:hypothetical protein
LKHHDVEHEVGDWGVLGCGVLEGVEGGPAVVVEGDEFPVDDGFVRKLGKAAQDRVVKSLFLRERKCSVPAALNATAR